VKRIEPASYSDLAATNEAEAITYLKRLEHTENFYGIKRFMNLKRWNTEPAWQEIITKTIPINDENMTFTLSPDSPLWIMAIPQNEINNNPNIKQNY
jgi:hypothetical protein